jgi:hypothetical protein
MAEGDANRRTYWSPYCQQKRLSKALDLVGLATPWTFLTFPIRQPTLCRRVRRMQGIRAKEQARPDLEPWETLKFSVILDEYWVI